MNCATGLSPKNVQHTDVTGRIFTQIDQKTNNDGNVAAIDDENGKYNHRYDDIKVDSIININITNTIRTKHFALLFI
jgi:hypothetical protein